jgi:hypothetical protein
VRAALKEAAGLRLSSSEARREAVGLEGDDVARVELDDVVCTQRDVARVPADDVAVDDGRGRAAGRTDLSGAERLAQSSKNSPSEKRCSSGDSMWITPLASRVCSQ